MNEDEDSNVVVTDDSCEKQGKDEEVLATRSRVGRAGTWWQWGGVT
jgi:hypothetical protein